MSDISFMEHLILDLSPIVRGFPLLFGALIIAALWFGLTSLIQFTTCLCSTDKRKPIASRPVHFFNWVLLIPFAGFLFLLLHPGPLKLRIERRIAFERVASAGGWEAIKKGCLLLTNDEYFVWYKRSNNYSELPPAIAALEPIEVRSFIDRTLHVPIVRIHSLGRPSTGADVWPHYGFWIVCGDAPADYRPKFDFGSMNFSGISRVITNSVFEIH